MTHQDYADSTAMAGNHTVSAFYDSYEDAEAAASRLRTLGVPDTQIRLTEGRSASTHSAGDANEDKGFFAMLGELFFPEDDRSAYAEGLNRGGHLLTVTHVSEAQYDAVIDILDDQGAVDMDERTATWREEGWSDDSYGQGSASASSGIASGQGSGGWSASDNGMMDDRRDGTLDGGRTTSAGASGLGGTGGSGATGGMGAAGLGLDNPGIGDSPESNAGMGGVGRQFGAGRSQDETVEVVQERLRVGKRDASRGTVRVRSYVVEEPVSETVTLREDRVEIERRPVDRPAGAAEGAFQERSIEAEEYREEAVVAKEARVVEEVSLRRTSDEHEETVSDTLRHTEVEIEDDRDDSLPSGSTPIR